jgi:hypothetical protein
MLEDNGVIPERFAEVGAPCRNLVALNQILGRVSRDLFGAGPVEVSWGFSNHPTLQPPEPRRA